MNQIYLGDCLDVLKTLPSESVHSCVTDCPYGLGTREPTVDEIIAYLQGAELRQNGDFMGRDWDVPSVAVWKECFRVLKPGGHLISFGGTRTWDLISLGLRAAGFENRDTIASNYGPSAVQWLTGQGFPKSLNIQKNMEKTGVGAETAAEYSGLGTALKPSWEPALLFRKPIAEKTVAKQVLATGTGAINIDGCRVRTADNTVRTTSGLGANFRDDGWIPPEKTMTGGSDHGRWPSNVLLTHAPGCKRVGSKKVDAPVINRFTDGAKPFGNGAGHAYESEQRGDAEGKEEIAIYECQEGCPVKTLDEQSGERPSGGRLGAAGMKPGLRGNTFESHADCAIGESTGGASRYFPQFDQDQEPYECVEGCPVKTLDDQSGVLKTSGGVLNRAGIGFHNKAKGNQDYVPPSEGGASRFFPQFEQETETFECVEGCPVKTLDEQSGILSSHNGGASKGIGFCGGSTATREHPQGADSGTAARFFPQFAPLEAPFMYATKVSKRERDAGLPKGTNNHPCLHPDALVLTDRGYESISTIEVGRRVYAANGRFHAVEHASSHPYTSPNLFSIFVRKAHEPTLASDNHPFLIWRPTRKTGRVVGGEVTWLRADQIQRGDYTMTPILKTAEEGVGDLPSEENFWYVFGLYLAEGVLHKAGHGDNAYPSFSLHKKEFYLVDRIRAATDCRVEEYPREGCAGTQVVAFDPAMGRLFKHLGSSGAATKVMASEIWSLPEPLRSAIFAGWLDGDGGFVRSECQGTTVSLRLASQLQLLGESIGYRARINRSVSKPGSGIGDRVFKSTRPRYQLNFYTPGRQRTTNARAKRPNPHTLEWDGTLFSLRMVKRVEQVPYDGLVYNLSVSGSPTFQTVVGMSHNTVKPQGLMRWLCRLVTPRGGTILDPYAGSGSTLVAALKEGFNFIGIERDPEFHRIATLRVEAAQPKRDVFDDMEDL